MIDNQTEINLEIIGQIKLLSTQVQALVRTLDTPTQQQWLNTVISDCKEQGISPLSGLV